MRLSDGTLALFKERCAGDATIYYRTSYYKQYNDDEGDLERIDAIFPTTAGNIGEAMLSRFASADFGGDKLFLSENGVFSVVLATNVATAERYSRERSRAVNARLVREVGLERTVATVYKDKYYLAVNGNVYVADARYRHTRADSMDGAWGYEWYFLTNIPANVFREIDGVLWFGTRDGRLCRFDEAYSDRTYALFEPGELTLFRESAAPPFFDGLTVNVTRHTALAVGDVFTTNAALFAVTLTDFVRVEGVRIYHRDLLRLAKLPEGLVVRVHGASEGAGLVSGEDYELRDIDLQEGCFSLYKDGAPVAVTSASFSLLRALKGLSLDVLAVEGSHVRLGLWGEPLVLVSDVALLTGKLWHREAVQARWISTVTDLGTSMAGKSLHRLSITCEPTVRGRVTFGYNTRLGSPARFTSAGSTLFSLSDLDFQSFSFETGFASSYSLKIFERNVNYLALAVESNTDTACAFNRLELLWSLGRYLEGLR